MALDQIRVVTWNILYEQYARTHSAALPPGVPVEWKSRQGEAIRIIQELKPDVLCLQESDLSMVDAIAKAAGLAIASLAYHGGNKFDGTAILCRPERVQMLVEGSESIQGANGWSTAVATLQVGDRQFRVASGHFQGGSERSHGDDQLFRVANASPSIHIIAGDFNDNGQAQNSRIKQLFRHYWVYSALHETEMGKGRRLDYIAQLRTPTMGGVDVILPTGIVTNAHQLASDHYPVAMDIDVERLVPSMNNSPSRVEPPPVSPPPPAAEPNASHPKAERTFGQRCSELCEFFANCFQAIGAWFSSLWQSITV